MTQTTRNTTGSAARPLPGRPRDSASRRSALREVVRRRPLPTFFVLSCLLAWWPYPLYEDGHSPTVQASFGPFVAAIVVLAVSGEPGAVRRLLRSMVTWRVPRRAYAAAFGIPVVINAAAIALAVALGASAPSGSDLGQWTQIPVTLLLVLLIPGLGGAWEEPGFRGFALGRMEQRFGVVRGPLLLGVFWASWHLPLFIVGDILWPDVVVIIAASVVIAAVFHAGRDSVLIAMLLHATNNAVGGGYASQLFHGGDATLLNVLVAAGWALIAAVVIASQRRPLRSAREQL